MKDRVILLIIGGLVTALCIAGFIVGAYLVATIIFCSVVLAPALIILLLVAITVILERHPIKTVNSFVVFWFAMVLLFGAIGGSVLIVGGISNGYDALMLVFGGIFALIGVGGAVGLTINITVHIRMVRVFKKGADGIGTYLDYGGGYLTGSTRYGATKQNWLGIKFRYNNGTQIIETKTNAVYSSKEAERLAEKGEFAIKYIGNRAVIVEQIKKEESKQD